MNDPDYGVPFLGSTDMLEADFTYLPLMHEKVAKTTSTISKSSLV